MKPAAILLPLFFALLPCPVLRAADPETNWQSSSPREELRPAFEQKDGLLSIDATGCHGAIGRWQTNFKVKGGQHYRFSAMRKTWDIDIAHVPRHIVERLT